MPPVDSSKKNELNGGDGENEPKAVMPKKRNN
jgi:hypothetical protein